MGNHDQSQGRAIPWVLGDIPTPLSLPISVSLAPVVFLVVSLQDSGSE